MESAGPFTENVELYRTSGVMTFIINQDGKAFQKDLGPDTAKVAAAMSEYNPDKTWMPAE
jgi:Protein of unknown function (DUF2950)